MVNEKFILSKHNLALKSIETTFRLLLQTSTDRFDQDLILAQIEYLQQLQSTNEEYLHFLNTLNFHKHQMN